MEGTKNVICIKWNNYRTSLTDGFQDLFRDETMVDVTLAAEGKLIKAHKVVLSVCSPYLKVLFESTQCQHPTVLMTDVKYNVLSNMLQFMYNGETKIKQQNIPGFLKLATKLQVKGLVEEAVKLLRNLMALKSTGVKKKKLKHSLITREEKLKLLRRNRNKKKITSKQRKRRSSWYSDTVKKSQKDVDEESASRGSYGTSVTEHEHDNDSYDKENNSSSSLLVDKNGNESTQEASKLQNNLQFGIRDYIKNVTIEDLETDVHHDLLCNVQNFLQSNGEIGIQSDMAHVSQSHKQNNMTTYVECTSQSQRQVDNVLPDNIQDISQNHEETDLLSDSQKVVQNDMNKVLASSRQYPLQHEELNNALNVQSNVQSDVQSNSNSGQQCLQSHMQNLLPNDVLITSPVSVDYPSPQTVQNDSPISEKQKRNVQTALAIDMQCPLRRTQNDVPYSSQRCLDNVSTNDEYPLQRDVQIASKVNVIYPLQSVVHDVQCPIQRDVQKNLVQDVQFPLIRDVESISPYEAINPLERDLHDDFPQDLRCPRRRDAQNASPSDVRYPVQNVMRKDVEYPIQRDVHTAAPIDVHYPLQRDLQDDLPKDLRWSRRWDIENASQNGVNYVLQRDLQNTLPIEIDYRLGSSAEKNLIYNVQYPLPNEWQNILQNNINNGSNSVVNMYSKRDAHSGLTTDAQGLLLNNLQKDSQRSGEVILTSSSNLKQSGVQCVSNDEQELEGSQNGVLDLRKHQHKSTNFALYSDINAKVSEAQLASQTVVQINSQKAAQNDAEIDSQKAIENVALVEKAAQSDAQNLLVDDLQKDSLKNAFLDSSTKIVEKKGEQSFLQHEEYPVLPNVTPSYLKKDPRKNVQYALSSCTEAVEQNNEQNIIQNNAQKDPHKNVQYDRNSDGDNVGDSEGHNIQAEAPQESQRNAQCAVKSDANIAEEVQSGSQTQAKTSLQNSANKVLRSDEQGSQKKVHNAQKKSAKNVKQSEVQFTPQTQDSQNSGQRVLRSNQQDSKKKLQNVSKSGATFVGKNEVESTAQTQDQTGSQNSGQRVLRSSLQDSKKKVQNMSKNSAKSVNNNEVQSSSLSPDRMGSQNFGQSVIKSSLQDSHKKVQNVSKNDAISVDNNKVQSSSESSDRMGSQNSGQRVMRSNVQGSKKISKTVSKNSDLSVDNNEVPSSSKSQDRIGSQNSGQRVLRSNVQDSQKKAQNASKNDAICVDNNEVQSSSKSQDRMASQSSEPRVMRSSVQNSKKTSKTVSKHGAVSVDNNEVQSSSKSQDRVGSQNTVQRVMRSSLQDSRKKVQNVSKSGAKNVEQTDVSQSQTQMDSLDSEQKVIRNIVQGPQKKASKRSAEIGEPSEVPQLEEDSDEEDASWNELKKWLHRRAHRTEKSGGSNNEEGELEVVAQTKPRMVSEHSTRSTTENFVQNDAQDSVKNIHHVANRRSTAVEQSAVQSSSQSQESSDKRNILQYDVQDSHKNIRYSEHSGNSDDEHNELQFVSETKVQPKIQYAPKRSADIVEDDEVELDSRPGKKSDKQHGSCNDLKKYRHKGSQQTVKNDEKSSKSRVETVTKTQVKSSSQKTGQNALQIGAEDSREYVQYIPRRRSGNDEAQFPSQTESETDLQISEQSVAQDKRHSVSQNKKQNDVQDVLETDLKNDPNKNVQRNQGSKYSSNEEDSDESLLIIDTEVKTKPSELENVLRNIRLDTWESKQRKKEHSDIETSNNSQKNVQKNLQRSLQDGSESNPIEIGKDTVGRSVLGKSLKKSGKEKLEDLEIRSISPEEITVITEYNVKSDINSNVNNNEPNLSKFYVKNKMEEDPQTNAEDTVNRNEKNISQRKLPILQSMLQQDPLNQMQYSSQNDVINVAEGKAQCTSSENVQMKPQSNVPNVLQSDVKNTTPNGVQSNSSKNVPTNIQSAVKKRKKNTSIRDQFSLPTNVQENPPQEIPCPVEDDADLDSFQSYSQNFKGNDPKKNIPSGSQIVSNNDLQENAQAPDQNALSKSDRNYNPPSEPERVLEAYAKMNLQIPIQIILRSDLERNATSEQSHDQRRPIQYTFTNDENNLGESGKQFVAQNDLQGNSKSNASNDIPTDVRNSPSLGVQYTVQGQPPKYVPHAVRSDLMNVHPDIPPVHPRRRVQYSLVTDLSNIARRTVEVVQDDAQMDSDSNVPNIVQRGVINVVPSEVEYLLPNNVQITPQSHVQHSVRSDVSSELPEAQSHVQNEGGEQSRYALICDVKNFVQSGLQCILRFGPPENVQCAMTSNLNHLSVEDSQQTLKSYLQKENPNDVPRAQSDFSGRNNDCPAGEQSEEVIYANDDRFGQVIEDVEIETVGERRNEIESDPADSQSRDFGPSTSRAERIHETPHSTSNIDVETVDDDDDDDFHAFKTLRSGFQKNQRGSGAKRPYKSSMLSSQNAKVKKKKK